MKRFKRILPYICTSLVTLAITMAVMSYCFYKQNARRVANEAYVVGYAIGYQEGYMGLERWGHAMSVGLPISNSLEGKMYETRFPTGYLEGYEHGAKQAAWDKEYGRDLGG